MNTTTKLSRRVNFECNRIVQLLVMLSAIIAVVALIVGAFTNFAKANQSNNDTLAQDNTVLAIASQNLPTEAEKARVKTQYEGFLAKNLVNFPTSCKIGDVTYYGFPKNDFDQTSQIKEDIYSHVTGKNEGVKTKTTLEHKKSGLNVIVESVLYENYAAYDGTIYIEWPEDGQGNSPIVSGLNAVDTYWAGANPTLTGSIGDSVAYKPYEETVNRQIIKQSNTGRGTEEDSSYYDFKYGDKGMRMAVSWPACWQFTLNNVANPDKTHMTACQTDLNTYLKPGEKLRSPLVAFVHYDRSGDANNDNDRSTNMWRHWMMDCNMNTITDKASGSSKEILPNPAIYAATSIQGHEMTRATDDNQIAAIKYYLNNKIPLTYWWMDAGWYYTVDKDGNGKTLDDGDWSKTGTGKVDDSRFPSQLKNITDFGKSNGMRSLLWFEPERVQKQILRTDGTTTNPNGVIADKDNKTEGDHLVGYGYKEALDWTFDRIKNVMETGGIDMYREDFNFHPHAYFQYGDKQQDSSGNRTGITENLHVQGHIELWDRILNYFPNATIDCCAGGGNRNDLNSMRRGIPLHKTDKSYEDRVWQQNCTSNMQKGIPYVGTKANGEKDPENNTKNANRYSLRTALAGGMVLGYDTDSANAPIDWDIVRDITEEHQAISHHIYSDYYVLEDWSDQLDKWAAGEYFDPKNQDGYVIAFRRDNADTSRTYTIKGLEASANYKIWFEDANNIAVRTGQDLMTNGVKFNIPTAQGSDILHIALASNAPADRYLVPSITQVSNNGQYTGAIAEAGEYNRVDVRFNMNLRNTILAAGEGKIEKGVQGDYADIITIDNIPVSELLAQNVNNVVMDYDAFNNILNIKVIKELFPADQKHVIKISGDLKSGGGAKIEKETIFNFDPSTNSWSKEPDPQPQPEPEPQPTPVVDAVGNGTIDATGTGQTGDEMGIVVLALTAVVLGSAFAARKIALK